MELAWAEYSGAASLLLHTRSSGISGSQPGYSITGFLNGLGVDSDFFTDSLRPYPAVDLRSSVDRAAFQ